MTDTIKHKNQITDQVSKSVKAKRPLWKRLIIWSFYLGLFGAIAFATLIISLLLYYRQDLPDFRQLADYEPSITTRVHAGDGSLLSEFARERRVFVPINAIPKRQIEAFLAAEDKNFYHHSGLDYMGMIRANIRNISNLMEGRALAGGSTITQQVAKIFLLTLDQKIDRKIKEMILTLRIEKAYSKDRIMELYLNEINFGNRSYGIASAALNYFNKSLDELSLGEMAYLAAVVKGPSNYHPIRRKERAIGRRNWVLSRMLILGHITKEEHDAAVQEDLVMRKRTGLATFKADYYEEAVRRRIKAMYGDEKLYSGGLSVRTSLEPRLQALAESALRQGLANYDRRHGWRGPIAKLSIDEEWAERLKNYRKSPGIPTWKNALVHDVRADGAVIGFTEGSYGYIRLKDMEWARPWLPGERVGKVPDNAGKVLAIGDQIVVEALTDPAVKMDSFLDPKGALIEDFNLFALRQIPEIQGAIVVLDPHTGRVLALVGGYDYRNSQYNRAIQAKRQPGSSFKPFVYAAGLESGLTPSSLVLDAAFVIDQGDERGKWKPRNSSRKFYGPSTLRLGIEKSRNLMTVRLAQHLGMRKVINYADKFNLAQNLEPSLAGSLGAGEVTLLDLAAAYGMLVNGGKRITPSLIDRIQDRRGKTIYPVISPEQKDSLCPGCTFTWADHQFEPKLPDTRETVVEPMTAYQLVSMMEGVATRGSARSLTWRVPNQTIGGKTGTTNNAADTWFMGFSADMVVGVFVGFDRPRSLGANEEGSTVAVPIFADFMKQALKDQPQIPFRIPPGIRLVRVNAKTGLPAVYGDKDVIWEAFKPGTEPRAGKVSVLGGGTVTTDTKKKKDTSGIY